jgi:hypothetical protein
VEVGTLSIAADCGIEVTENLWIPFGGQGGLSITIISIFCNCSKLRESPRVVGPILITEGLLEFSPAAVLVPIPKDTIEIRIARIMTLDLSEDFILSPP